MYKSNLGHYGCNLLNHITYIKVQENYFEIVFVILKLKLLQTTF